MKKFISFSFDKMNYLAVFVLIVSVIWAKAFNIVEIQENTIYENIAVLPLIAGIIICLKSKSHKVFFNFIALILFLAIAREFSYGRVPFAAIPDSQGHDFYPWSHYKYGYLANIFVGIYIALGCLYALINKIWIDIIEIVKKVPIPFWSFLIALVCVVIQEISEHSFENTVVEEIAEFVIYSVTFAIVWIYYKKSN
ncbi:hypothetical protein IJ531_06480 [bacterium]|nr:hypothetical protein [bacterium]